MAAHPRDRRRPVHYDPSLAALQYLDQQQQWQALTLATGGGGGAPSGPAGGDLAGTYPNPTVTRARGLRDSGGTTYPMGAIGANELLQESGGDIVGVGVSVLLAASLTLPIFGTGIDGNVTLVANIGLTRSMNYNDLDLAGFTIKTNGHHLRVAGTLTGTGTIERDGGAALAQAGGVTDGGSNGPYGHGSNGSNGATAAGGGNGGAIAALTNAWPVTFLGGTAGKGGTGGTATNAGGVVSNPTAVNSIRDSWLLTDQGHGMNQGNVTLFRGGILAYGGGLVVGGGVGVVGLFDDLGVGLGGTLAGIGDLGLIFRPVRQDRAQDLGGRDGGHRHPGIVAEAEFLTRAAAEGLVPPTATSAGAATSKA